MRQRTRMESRIVKIAYISMVVGYVVSLANFFLASSRSAETSVPMDLSSTVGPVLMAVLVMIVGLTAIAYVDHRRGGAHH